SNQEEVLTSLKAQKSQKEEVLSELRAQALKLETVVVGLTGGAQTIQKEGELKPEMEVSRKSTEKASGGAALAVPFEGGGLNAPLVLPVLGTIVTTPKKNEIDQLVASKGYDFAAPAGSEVHSVEKGRVMFVGRMPVYGNIIIIDHGLRFYTL